MASKNYQRSNKNQSALTTKASETEELDDMELDDVDSLEDDDSINAEFSAKEPSIDSHTVAARQRLHDKLLSDVEDFLAKGGEIQQVASYINAGAPKRHVNKFGNNSM